MTGMSVEEGINQLYHGGRHVIILGAGASIAATLRNPEASGRKLPDMNNLVEVVGLQDLVDQLPSEDNTAPN